jgi:hypothetical protein
LARLYLTLGGQGLPHAGAGSIAFATGHPYQISVLTNPSRVLIGRANLPQYVSTGRLIIFKLTIFNRLVETLEILLYC